VIPNAEGPTQWSPEGSRWALAPSQRIRRPIDFAFSTRRHKPDGTYADLEAAWVHRKGGGPGEKDELFFGYYLSLATMVGELGGATALRARPAN
jgi:hypothetical protein